MSMEYFMPFLILVYIKGGPLVMDSLMEMWSLVHGMDGSIQ